MDITLHPDKMGTKFTDNGEVVHYLYATELKTGITVNLALTPELKKKLAPLQEAEKKRIADEAFERGVQEGRSCQAILELQGRDRFIAFQKEQVRHDAQKT